jgi:putative addiction module component (TIGR02574 family)
VTKPAEKVLSEALTLDTRERAEIAAKLIASLDGERDEDVEAAWAAEVDRRMREVEAGHAKLVPWAEIERRVEKEIRKR